MGFKLVRIGDSPQKLWGNSRPAFWVKPIGVCFFIDVNTVKCTRASQNRNENPKKWLNSETYIPFYQRVINYREVTRHWKRLSGSLEVLNCGTVTRKYMVENHMVV